MAEMSRTFNFDTFDNLIAEGLEEYYMGEHPDTDALKSVHDNNLMALHEFEKLCWQRVEQGKITATEAEEAIWSFIGHIEKPERLPGQIGSVAVQLTLEFE